MAEILSLPRSAKEPPEQPPALLDAAALAALLSCSLRHVRRMDAAGQLPAPIRLGTTGKAVRWRRSEVLAWIDAGCPSRKAWNLRQSH
jgi:predicted DNA-binding transcriptional regulator AlpA